MSEVGFWDDAEVIHTYTRAQALEDGVLVELDPKVVKEAGIKFPVAVTAAVFARCIALTPKAEEAYNDVSGRTWDVLWMLRSAMGRARGSVLQFEVLAVTDRLKPTLHRLKAVCGPGDNAEPVLTVSLPNED